jgi:PAS domain S-box-containing protein
LASEDSRDGEQRSTAVAAPADASDRRFRLLVEGVTDYAIFMLDPTGRITTWNAGAERLKGYRPDEIIGRHFSIFYPPDAIARRWPEYELEVAARDGRFEDEGWRIRKDGTRFWANVVITALRDTDGTFLGYSKITRDLSQRRLHEEALRQSEERFRLLVEGVRDYGIFMLDPEGHVSSWNEGAQRIKGYKPEEIIGQHFSRFYTPEDLARGWPEHELSVAKLEGRFEDEGWRVRKDGTRFWANVIITALHDPHGELRGFSKITRDLTERRKIELLSGEAQRVNEFLAMLGHELRNPLAPIRNAVAVLNSGTPDPSSVTWASTMIDRQVAHLSRIVDDLLDMSRVSSGKITMQRETLDMGALVGRAVESARSLFTEKRQRLDVRLPPSPLRVVGDATRLSQVTLNLLTNAHKYTPEGGRVEVILERDGRCAQLRVADDGIGIPGDLLPRVFDLFVQGERSLDRAQGGLGLGLALVKKLVEMHGGSVSAASHGQDRGSTFFVRLPAVAQAVPHAEKPLAPEITRPASGIRVLVVDDNRDAAESQAMLARLWGYDVRMAHDGPEALRAAAEYAPHVVFLDIGLPGMSGYDVAQRLRDTKAVLVAMTGYGQAEDVERAQQAGMAHHLVKPVDPLRLQRFLADVTATLPTDR